MGISEWVGGLESILPILLNIKCQHCVHMWSTECTYCLTLTLQNSFHGIIRPGWMQNSNPTNGNSFFARLGLNGESQNYVLLDAKLALPITNEASLEIALKLNPNPIVPFLLLCHEHWPSNVSTYHLVVSTCNKKG